MAWINRSISRGEQRQQSRLRPLQMKGGFAVAIRRGRRHVDPPSFTKVETQPFLSFVCQQVEGAFDVLGTKRFAVVPFDAVAELESASLDAQLVASSGRIVSKLFCGTC